MEDPNEPVRLRCLVTFRTYGSWLHGDPRGSVDGRRNQPGQAYIPPVAGWEAFERSQMKGPSVILSIAQRAAATSGIRRVSVERGWPLLALNVRTNHVHLVIETSCERHRLLRDLKSAATRDLHRAGLADEEEKIWARGGSVEALMTPEAVARAVRYVVDGQGTQLGEMPDLG